MKKFKVLALALVIGTSSLFAANGNDLKEPNKKMRSEIISLLQAPILNIEVETIVTITFTFSSEGEVVILNVDSRNKDILNYVRENLNYKKIESSGEQNKLYTMPLKVLAS